MATQGVTKPVSDGKRNLVWIWDERINVKDFQEIASEIVRLNPSIAVHIVSPNDTDKILPDDKWRRPSITISTGHPGRFEPRRGPLFCNLPISKNDQFDRMQRAGLSIPRSETFVFGSTYNPAEWGEIVLLKSARFSSRGVVTHAVRTRVLHLLEPERFPAEYVNEESPLFIQPFIDTGTHPNKYRVLSLCGEPLYAQNAILEAPRPDLANCTDAELFDSVVDTGGGKRSYHHGDYPEILVYARRVAAVFAEIPLLGIDILKDERSGKLYALEINAGGNVWHFSSRMWAERRRLHPEVAVAMRNQLGAWKAAARALVRQAITYAQ